MGRLEASQRAKVAPFFEVSLRFRKGVEVAASSIN